MLKYIPNNKNLIKRLRKKMNEEDLKQITVDTYNKSARELAEYFKGIGSRKKDIDLAVSLVEKRNPRVLEIGCGDGRDAEYILRKTNSYTGLDISAEMIRINRSKNPKGKFIIGDQDNLKNYRGEYDIIFAFASLLHSNKKNMIKIIRKLVDILSERGVIFISLKMDKRYRKIIKEDRFGRRVFYFYTPKMIENFSKKYYSVVFLEKQKIGSTDWFSIILQKRSI